MREVDGVHNDGLHDGCRVRVVFRPVVELGEESDAPRVRVENHARAAVPGQSALVRDRLRHVERDSLPVGKPCLLPLVGVLLFQSCIGIVERPARRELLPEARVEHRVDLFHFEAVEECIDQLLFLRQLGELLFGEQSCAHVRDKET